MITQVQALTVNGLETTLIDVEVDINQWMPNFTIVGLPDQWVQESKERIRSALKASAARLPSTRITVNLAPAHIKKSWPSFDLAIAVGILMNEGYISETTFCENAIFLWELSLDGRLRHIPSVLPAVIGAKQKGIQRIFIPAENKNEAAIIPDIDIISVSNLQELIQILNKEIPYIPQKLMHLQELSEKRKSSYDFAHIVWQQAVKRALEIAAAGGHNVLMQWPPGSGKTLLAKSFPSILPDLSLDEAIEISKLYSVSWLLSNENPLITERPFRSIHHTASSISIIWWGRNARPGEISLAHKWVLFLDEILEFPKTVLEVLRQPLEDGEIHITRVHGSYTYPAKFSLLAAMNPCPCGYLSDPERECICTQQQVFNYRARLSGPLQDRIDIFLEVPKVPTQDFRKKKDEEIETSASIKLRVEKARKRQIDRFQGTHMSSNSEMKSSDIKKYCHLDSQAENILMQAVDSMKLSARSYYRMIKLAQTLADLSESDIIAQEHILEALSYRKKEE